MKKLLSSAAAAFFICASNAAAAMTLNVLDSDLRQTIMLVARNGGLNVSVDDSVKGNISITLNDVEPEKALEIIAKTSGLNLIRDGSIYIMTSNLYGGALMRSYVLPVKFADPESLRKAVIMTLDPDATISPSQMTRTRNSDGTDTFRYSYDTDTNAVQKDKREERVLINAERNCLILFGTETEYLRAKNLLDSLDRELKQVSVEAKIIVIDKNASKNLGIDWTWSNLPQYPSREIEINETSSGRIIETERYKRKSSDDTGYGIIQFGRGPEGIPFEMYYGARINALVTNGKAKILSRPNVTTVQGREAVIYIGNEVPIEKSQTIDSTTTSSYEYKDAGIKLKYTPRVNADGTITAKLYTEVSTPDYDKNAGAYRFNTRTAETTVTVRDGEPMVIGGLIGAEESKAVSKIPFLGDLPILGALFRNNRKSKSESELMIFITAHVLKGAASN